MDRLTARLNDMRSNAEKKLSLSNICRTKRQELYEEDLVLTNKMKAILLKTKELQIQVV